jgi:hypothetical protein
VRKSTHNDTILTYRENLPIHPHGLISKEIEKHQYNMEKDVWKIEIEKGQARDSEVFLMSLNHLNLMLSKNVDFDQRHQNENLSG